MISDVRPLDREDFLRLNHNFTGLRMIFNNDKAIEDDNEIAKAERIFLNDDTLSSLELENDEVDYSTQRKRCDSKQPYSHVSSSLVISGFNGNALSEETNTLSVKLLNKLNVIIIASDEITPTETWNEVGFFTKETNAFLMQFYRNGIERQCAYGWPHMMRTNSMFAIDEPVKNLMMCLPTVCSIKVSRLAFALKKNKPIRASSHLLANHNDLDDGRISGADCHYFRDLCQRS